MHVPQFRGNLLGRPAQTEQMAAHEDIGFPAPDELSPRPAAQAMLIVNALALLSAIGQVHPARRTAPRKFPANRARRAAQKPGDLPLAAAPKRL
jgi:hypothetical protein